jgi:hypothetical protein
MIDATVAVAPPEAADIDELATVLFALDAGSDTTARTTSRIAREITRWALSRGWSPRPEARVDFPISSGSDPRLGYVDLVIRRRSPESDLAIEIDSTDKPWSLAKLRYLASTGMHAVWVRWGDEAWAGLYYDVDTIQLPTPRRSRARPRLADQLTFWL